MLIKPNSIQISPQEYQALLRKDFYSFIERAFYEINPETQFLPNWHIEKIAQELEECRSGNIKRLIINLPPRSLKSSETVHSQANFVFTASSSTASWPILPARSPLPD